MFTDAFIIMLQLQGVSQTLRCIFWAIPCSHQSVCNTFFNTLYIRLICILLKSRFLATPLHYISIDYAAATSRFYAEYRSRRTWARHNLLLLTLQDIFQYIKFHDCTFSRIKFSIYCKTPALCTVLSGIAQARKRSR